MEIHDRQQVAEVYTIRQVADLTGVPENTIRSWERRFGLPAPERTIGKQRRYTRADIDLIKAIQAARDAGRTMDQAIADALGGVRMRHTTPLQIVAPDTPHPSNQSEPSKPSSAMANRLAAELARSNLPRGNVILSDAYLSLPVEPVIQHVLLAASGVLREKRLHGDLDPVSEMQAQTWIERKLQFAYEASGPEAGDHHLAVIGLDEMTGPSPALGIAIALSRGGFRTSLVDIGPNPTLAREVLSAMHPSSVVLHASTPDGLIARVGSLRLIDEMRDQGTWKGHHFCTGGSVDLNITTIPPAHVIGEDMDQVAGRVRQVLGTPQGPHRETP